MRKDVPGHSPPAALPRTTHPVFQLQVLSA